MSSPSKVGQGNMDYYFFALCRTSINSLPWGTRKQVGIYDIGQSPREISLETEESLTNHHHMEVTDPNLLFFFTKKIRHFYRCQFSKKLDPGDPKFCHATESKVEFLLPPDRQAERLILDTSSLTFLLFEKTRGTGGSDGWQDWLYET